MKELEMPDWEREIRLYDRSGFLTEECVNNWLNYTLSDKWIVDKSDMVELWGDPNNMVWSKNRAHNHKAYLIGIELVNQDSCTDVLKAWVKQYESGSHRPLEFYTKAKAALARETK